MKAALSVWEGRIAPVFDVSQQAVLMTIANGAVAARGHADIEAPTPAAKVDRLLELGVEVLICGAISRSLHQELEARGVRVIGFVAGEIDAVMATFLAGALPTPVLCMPGCRGRQRRFRGGPGGRRGAWGRQGRR